MMEKDKILLSAKELAKELGRSEGYVRHMIMCGFRMRYGRNTIEEAMAFLENHPHPCSEHRKNHSVNNGE